MILGVGIDLVEITRIEAAMNIDGFAERILTDGERERKLSIHYVAGRWAAKEAAKKVIPTLNSWHQIEVLTAESGEPYAVIHGGALAPGTRLHLSISHDARFAVAVAILESV